MYGSGAIIPRFAPLASGNVWEENVSVLTASLNQEPAKKVANQLNYSVASWSPVGWGNFTEGNMIVCNMRSFSPTFAIAPAGAPTQKITYIKSNGEPRTELEHAELQKKFLAVPMPQLWKTPSGQVIDNIGTDKEIVIIQPSTGKYWEMWLVEGTEGAYTFQNGGYVENYPTWNGIFPVESDGKTVWGASASGLALTGGTIMLSDLVRILQGGELGHGVALSLPVLGGETEIVAPATKGQAAIKHIPELHEGSANPAYPERDKVEIGTWLRFPPGSNVEEYGSLTHPIEKALYRAIQKYGMGVTDGAGSCALAAESALTLGSVYSESQLNPYINANGVSSTYEWANKVGYTSRINPAQQSLSQAPGGTTSFLFNLFKLAGSTLEVLEPRSS